MTCDEAKNQLVLLAYEELLEEQQATLELHLHGCPECEQELAALNVFSGTMQQEMLPTVSPNLLAAARLRLDDALNTAHTGSWLQRLQMGAIRTWQHLYAAPALATLLVGVGFLSGNLLSRYQTTSQMQAQAKPPAVPTETQGSIGTVSGITRTENPDVVEVQYNRVVPETFRGRIDEPVARQLLLLAAQEDASNTLRADSVGYLARACDTGNMCQHGSHAEDANVRDALLVSLRYDKSLPVRLKALEGLKRFIGEDQKVRDAVLESLMRDRSPEVKTRAIGMLAPVQGDSSVRRVLHTVSKQDENPYIRNASMQALGSGDAIQ